FRNRQLEPAGAAFKFVAPDVAGHALRPDECPVSVPCMGLDTRGQGRPRMNYLLDNILTSNYSYAPT
ncbi:MAG: hypothetical protein ACKOB7_08845, partial [Methylocystis sp.]